MGGKNSKRKCETIINIIDDINNEFYANSINYKNQKSFDIKLKEINNRGEFRINKYLLMNKKNINDQLFDYNGQTVLNYAVSKNMYFIVKLLLGMNAKITILDYDGLSPFDYTINDVRIFELLV